ncbi:sugar-binding domain-containing protein [Paenibacillus qinlingensis]|uniref:Deoxyribonucleoside regulator n=1 Tax=Paenibacillus qinlingensis TaxID=1837343 RepID=A0ABU1NX37_9BACL|nr:sugar-binding domain-containing protein [Paenibacillus qinlingensis]MDR6552023.1 deoxyribonucleoside regulator [Paenibacillus qinlingensis]
MTKTQNNEHLSKESFLERISRMYYVLEMSQQEICEQLNIGRSSVARFLSEARERGIVQFQIRSDLDGCRHTDLESQLMKRFKMKDCVIFRSDESGTSFEVLASQYLNSILPTHGSIGLGWGKTLHAVGTQMHLCDPRPGLKVIQLSGGSGAKEELVPAATVIQLWAQSLRCRPILLPAPAIAVNVEVKNSFLQDPSIQEIVSEIKKIDAAVVGIGHTGEDATIITSNLVPGLGSQALSASSVGDLIFHFYNEKGVFSEPSLSSRVVGATPEEFQQIELRIGVAHGVSKKKAIQGALQGQLIHVLITTEETARELLATE